MGLLGSGSARLEVSSAGSRIGCRDWVWEGEVGVLVVARAGVEDAGNWRAGPLLSPSTFNDVRFHKEDRHAKRR